MDCSTVLVEFCGKNFWIERCNLRNGLFLRIVGVEDFMWFCDWYLVDGNGKPWQGQDDSKLTLILTEKDKNGSEVRSPFMQNLGSLRTMEIVSLPEGHDMEILHCPDVIQLDTPMDPLPEIHLKSPGAPPHPLPWLKDYYITLCMIHQQTGNEVQLCGNTVHALDVRKCTFDVKAVTPLYGMCFLIFKVYGVGSPKLPMVLVSSPVHLVPKYHSQLQIERIIPNVVGSEGDTKVAILGNFPLGPLSLFLCEVPSEEEKMIQSVHDLHLVETRKCCGVLENPSLCKSSRFPVECMRIGSGLTFSAPRLKLKRDTFFEIYIVLGNRRSRVPGRILIQRTRKRKAEDAHCFCDLSHDWSRFFKCLVTDRPEFGFNKTNINVPLENNYTLLHYAARFGAVRMTKYLLENGANPDGEDEEGLSPLYWAIYGGHEETAKLLLPTTTNLEVPGNQQEITSLLELSFLKMPFSSQIPSLLLQKGTEWTRKDDLQNTILHHLAQWGSHSMLSLLEETEEFESLLNQRNSDGQSALHLAAIHRNYEVFLEFLRVGALFFYDNEGKFPLFYIDKEQEHWKYLTQLLHTHLGTLVEPKTQSTTEPN